MKANYLPGRGIRRLLVEGPATSGTVVETPLRSEVVREVLTSADPNHDKRSAKLKSLIAEAKEKGWCVALPVERPTQTFNLVFDCKDNTRILGFMVNRAETQRMPIVADLAFVRPAAPRPEDPDVVPAASFLRQTIIRSQRLWNDLAEIESWRRAEWVAMFAGHPKVQPLIDDLRKVQAEIQEIEEAFNEACQAEGSRSKADTEHLDELKKRGEKLWTAYAEARKEALKDNPELQARDLVIAEEADRRKKAAYATDMSTLAGREYVPVKDRCEVACKTASGPQPKKLDGFGWMGFQLSSPIRVADLFTPNSAFWVSEDPRTRSDERHPVLVYDPTQGSWSKGLVREPLAQEGSPSRRSQRRKGSRTKLLFTPEGARASGLAPHALPTEATPKTARRMLAHFWVKSGMKSRTQRFTEVVLPFVLHQPFPPEGLLKAIGVDRQAQGFSGVAYKLTLTFDAPAETVTHESTTCAALDLGWRELPNGQIRVAVLVDEHGHTEEILVPESVIQEFKKAEETHSRADKERDEMKALLVGMKAEFSALPDWFPQKPDQLRARKRFRHIAQDWDQDRIEGDDALFERYMQLFQHYKHLINSASGQRASAVRSRNGFYAHTAAELTARYGTLFSEQMKGTRFVRRPKVWEKGLSASARRHRHMAAPFTFINQLLPRAAANRGCTLPKINPWKTSQKCLACEATTNVGASPVHTCEHCHMRTDRDVVGAGNLLIRGLRESFGDERAAAAREAILRNQEEPDIITFLGTLDESPADHATAAE